MRARVVTAILAPLVLVPSMLLAQAATGALEGRVVSTGREPLEQATVTVTGPALQGARTAISDEHGRFVFLALPSGRYAVAVRRLGYAAARLTEVVVRLGATTALGEVALTPQAVSVTPVEVSAVRPLLDPLTTASATPLDSSFFLALATPRDFAHLAELAALAAPGPFDSVGGRYLGATIGGASEVENAYYIDGVDLSGIGEYAVAEKALPFNFVRDVQVLTSGYEAEYGRGLGGIVNVVTNAGGNEFRGQFVTFYSGDVLRSAPRWGYNENQILSYATWDVGVSLSGPIRRDRLWYFVAYDPAFAAHDVARAGLEAQRDRLTRHLMAGKLTWRAGEGTDVTLTILGDPSIHRMVAAPSSGSPEFVANADAVLGRETSGGFTGSLQLQRQRGRTLLTASVARTDNHLSHIPLAPYGDMAALARAEDWTTNTVSGNSGVDSHARNQRTAGRVAVTYAGGAHTAKAGAEYEDSRALIVPHWSILTVLGASVDPVYPYRWTRVDQWIEGWNRTATLYAQDSWAVAEGLRLNAGVRWDGQWLGGASGMRADITGQVAPRLGVVMRPGGSGRDKLTASWGRFYEQVPAYSAALWGGRGCWCVLGYAADPLSTASPGDSLVRFWLGGAGDAHLKGQYHDEGTVGYERRIGTGTRLGIRAIARSLIWALDDDGSVPADGGYLFGNPGRGRLAFLPRATRDYHALEVTVERAGPGPLAVLASYVLSSNRGNYAGLFDEDTPGLGGGGNAGNAYEAPEPGAISSGPLPNDRPHLFKLSAAYRLGTRATFGASFLAASGTPRSETGTSVFGWPYVVFIGPRGSLGRTPWIWDLGLHGTVALPERQGLRPRLVLDVFHVGSPRRAIWYDDQHYLSPQDSTGAWSGPNPNYGRALAYQRPMSARLGLLVDF